MAETNQEHIELKQLVGKWAQKKATENSTKLKWIDWEYARGREEYKTFNDRYRAGEIKISRVGKPIPEGEGKRRPEFDGHHKFTGGGLVGSQEIESTTTARVEKSVSYSKTLDLGLDIGIDYYAQLGIHVDYNISKTKGEIKTEEKVKREKLTIKFEEGFSYEIIEEVFETVIAEEIIREIEVEGRIPIFFKKDIKLSDNGRGNGEHQLNFVSIAHIMSDLQREHLLPKGIECQCNLQTGKVIFKQKGRFTFTICKFETKTDKTPITGYIFPAPLASTEKSEANLHIAPKVIDKKAIVYGGVRFSPAIGLNLAGALDSDQKTDNLNKTITTIGKQKTNVEPSVIGEGVVVYGGVDHAPAVGVETQSNQVKEANPYLPVLQADKPKNQEVEKFAHRIFLILKPALEEKFQKEIAQDPENCSRRLAQLEGEISHFLNETASGCFDVHCKGKEAIILKQYAQEIAKEITDNCKILKNFKMHAQYIEDGFSIAAQQSKTIASVVTLN